MLPLIGMSRYDSFEADIDLEDGRDLSEFGFEAEAIHIPGHSKGSIGILTTGGDMFCGDILGNTGKPEKTTLVDDPVELDASVEKIKSLGIKTVYPGHGKPFQMDRFLENSQ